MIIGGVGTLWLDAYPAGCFNLLVRNGLKPMALFMLHNRILATANQNYQLH